VINRPPRRAAAVLKVRVRGFFLGVLHVWEGYVSLVEGSGEGVIHDGWKNRREKNISRVLGL